MNQLYMRAPLSRTEASQYLKSHYGSPLYFTPKTLAKLAMHGDGPRYSIVRGRTAYHPDDIDEWALKQLKDCPWIKKGGHDAT